MCDKIDSYGEGELTREETVLFEKHLESCPSCRRELDWLESLNIMFSTMPARKPPRGIESAVLGALGFRRRPVWSGALGLAAASVVGVWLMVLPILVRVVGVKSLSPVAKGLAGISALLSGLLRGMHVAVDMLGPLNTTLTALAKVAGHVQFPAVMVSMLVVGLMAGLGIWFSIRGVRHAHLYV